MKVKQYKQKGFTITELLVVLALTSISVTMSYSALNYVQKLFSEQKNQNRFLNEFTDLKQRLDHEALHSKTFTEENETTFGFRNDSLVAELRILEDVILLHKHGRCDTFHIRVGNIRREYAPMLHPAWINKLISVLRIETKFTKQVFALRVEKEHSAAVRLGLLLDTPLR